MEYKQIKNVWVNAEQCKSCAIRHLVLFSDLQHQDFEKIHYPIEDIFFKPNSVIYQQNDKLKFVYTIRSGLIKLVQYLDEGECRIVRLLGQGDLLGIESLHHHKANHTAITLDDVKVCKIPHSVISDLQKNTPRLHDALQSSWQETLSKADMWITQLSTGKVKSRVARLLLLLQNSQGESFVMPTREDMGTMLAITTESASKVTAEFKRNGWLIAFKNNRSKIDKEALKKI